MFSGSLARQICLCRILKASAVSASEFLENVFKVLRDELRIGFSYVGKKLGISVTMLSEITGLQTDDE